MNTLSRSPHLKLQEMCDCYLETDFSKKLAAMKRSLKPNVSEDAYKYLALALLEATTEQASELSFVTLDNLATVNIESSDKTIHLPAPSPNLLHVITTIIRDITHIDEGNGESSLILGLKSGQLDLSVLIQKDSRRERIVIGFPNSESKTISEEKPVAAGEEKKGGELNHWKCGKCKYTFTAASLPEQCPVCDEKCDFLNITCYTPECGGPGNIDPRLI